MASNIEVTLGIKADASQARAEIQSLGRSLANIASNTPRFSKDFDMKNAISDAKELQSILLKSFNADTGQLDLSKFSNQLTRSGKTLDDYRRSFNKLGTDGSQAFSQLTSSIAKADAPIVSLGSKITKMGESLKKAIGWQISSSVIHGMMGAYQQAFGYAEDLNKSLTNIQIVSGQSKEQMAQFAQEANRAAQALSTTTTAYTDAALIFYQQGLNKDEVAERTEATIKMSQVTGDNATEVSSYMTAIWNNFDNGSQKLSYFSDVITALGASTASSSSEIAEGLSKFASIGETVGLSYEYATSSLATIVSATRQSADTVGTALKTIFSRMQGLKLGETLDDGTSLNKYSKALSDVGISIKDDNGELKAMDNIIDEMGAKWKELSKDQKMALAQTVAGTRQYTQLISLMDNYDKFKENVETARNSEGTVERQAKVYEKSWEAAQKRVQASMESIYMTLINDDFFIKLNDAIAEALKGVKGLIEGFGGVKGIILQAGGIFATMFAKRIPEVTEKLKDNFRIITGRAKKDTSNLQAQAAQQESLNSKEFLAKGDYTRAAESAGLARVADMKAKLTNATNRLSESEKREYQQQIALMELRAKNLQETAEAATQKNKEINNSQKRMNNLIYQKSIDVNNAEDNGAEYGIRMGELLDGDYLKKTFKNSGSQKKVSEIIEKQLRNSFGSKIENFSRKELSENIFENMAKESSRSQAEIVSKMVTSFRTEAQKQQKIAGSAHLLNKELVQSGASLLDKGKNGGFTDASAYKKEVQSLMTSLKSMADKSGVPFKQIADDIDKMSQKINDISTDDAQTAIENLNKKIEELINQDVDSVANKIQRIEEGAEEQSRDLTQAEGMIVGASPEQITESVNAVANSGQIYAEAEQELNSFNEAQAEVPVHTMSISEALTMATGTMMSMVSSIQAVSDCFKILGDDEATATEKIGAFLGMAMNVLSTIGQMTNQFTMMRVSQMGSTAATTAQAGATTAATGAQLGLNAAMKANPVGFVIMGIEALIAVIMIFVAICGNMKSAYENAMESFKKSSEDLKEAREDLKSLQDELEKNQERINELESQGSITIIEQDELDKLKQANELLEQQIDLKKGIEKNLSEANAANAEAVLTATDGVSEDLYFTRDMRADPDTEKFNKKFRRKITGDYDVGTPLNNGGEKGTYGITFNLKGDLLTQLKGMTDALALAEETLKNYKTQEYGTKDGVTESINNIADLTQKRANLIETIQEAVNGLLDENGQVIRGYEDLYEKTTQGLEDQLYRNDPAKLAQIQLDRVTEKIDASDLEEVKNQIEKFGDIDFDALPKNLKDSLQKAAIAAKDKVKMFKNMGIKDITKTLFDNIKAASGAVNIESIFDKMMGEDGFSDERIKSRVETFKTEYKQAMEEVSKAEEQLNNAKDEESIAKAEERLAKAEAKATESYRQIKLYYGFYEKEGSGTTLEDVDRALSQKRVLEIETKITGLEEQIGKYKENDSLITSALAESNSGSVAKETVDKIKQAIYGLDDSIMSATEKEELFNSAVQATTNGIQLNGDALDYLRDKMDAAAQSSLKDTMDELQNKAGDLKSQIESLMDGGVTAEEVEQLDLLSEELDLTNAQIRDIELIQAQWGAATSAYQRYKEILEGGNQSDNYENLGKPAYNAAKEAMENGFTDSSEVNAFGSAIFGKDWKEKFSNSAEEMMEEYNKVFTTIDGQDYSISSFWQYNEDDGKLNTNGLLTALNIVKNSADEINKEVEGLVEVTDDGAISISDFSEDALGALSKALGGIDPSLVADLFKAMNDIEGLDFDLSGFEKLELFKVEKKGLDEYIQTLEDSKKITTDTAKTIREQLTMDTSEIIDSNKVKSSINEINNSIKTIRKTSEKDGVIDIKPGDGAYQTIAELNQKKKELEHPVVSKISFDKIEAEKGMNEVLELYSNIAERNNLKTKLQIAIDTGASEEEQGKIEEEINKVEEKIQTIIENKNNDGNIADLKVAAKFEDEDDIEGKIDKIESLVSTNDKNQLIVTTGTEGEEKVISKLEEIKDKSEDEDKTITVKMDDQFTAAYNIIEARPDIEKTVTVKHKDIYETVNKGSSGGEDKSEAYGSASFAYGSGDISVHGSGEALGGELGPEIVVRDGKWFTIGEKGAEFFNYKDKDIIFNAEQTKQLLENGHISNGYTRARQMGAFVGGTAFNDPPPENLGGGGGGKIPEYKVGTSKDPVENQYIYNINGDVTVTRKDDNSGNDTDTKITKDDSGDSKKKEETKKSKTKTSAKDKKEYKEEIERYHEINDIIDNLNKKLDITASKKELAFGSKQTDLLQKENKQLKQSIKNYDALAAEAKKYLDTDKKLLEKKYGAKIDKDTGVITNYEEIVKQQVDQYNAAVAAYNEAARAYDAASDDDKESLKENLDKLGEEVDKANKKYEEFKKNVSNYEESNDKYLDAQKQKLEAQAKLVQNWIDSIETELEIKIKLDDHALKFIDYQLEKSKEDAYSIGETLDNLGRKGKLQNDIAETNISEANQELALYQDKNGKSYTVADFEGLSTKQQKELLESLTSKEKVGKDGKPITMKDDMVNAILGNIEDGLGALNDLKQTYHEVFESVDTFFETYKNDLDSVEDSIDKSNGIIKTYEDMVDIVGKEKLGFTNELLESWDDAILQNSIDKLGIAKKELGDIKTEYKYALGELAKAQNDNDKEMIYHWSETVKKLKQQVEESEQELADSWTEALQYAADAFERKINAAVETFEKSIAGANQSLSGLHKIYDRQKEIDKRYLEDYRQIYELSKLTRSITNSIDETDNLATKESLRDLQEEINQISNEDVKLSEYDLEVLQKRFELEQARANWQDAQISKTQVRMVRDNEGNFGYVYTADDNAVQDAQQAYEDKLYELQKLNSDYVEEIENMILQLNETFIEEMQRIYSDSTLTTEARKEQIESLKEWYQQMLDFYTQQENNTLENNRHLWEVEWREYSDKTGYKISADENYVDKYEDTTLAIIDKTNSLEERQQLYMEAAQKLFGETETAYKNYGATVDSVNEVMTEGTEDAATAINEIITGEGGIVKAAEDAAKSAENLRDKWKSGFSEIEKKTRSAVTTIGNNLKKLEELLGITKEKTEEVEKKKPNKPTKPTETPTEPPKETPTEPPKETKSKLTDELKDGIAGAIWYVGSSGWGNDPYRNGKLSEVFGKENAEKIQGYINAHVSGDRLINGGFKHSSVEYYDKKQWKYPTAKDYFKFDTGGYTGEWGGLDGKFAMLHQKEIVLNKTDTKNLLDTVEIVRGIVSMIDANALSAQVGFGDIFRNIGFDNSQELNQNVTITAEFPNATDRNEIVEAFETLVNTATQYANRK